MDVDVRAFAAIAPRLKVSGEGRQAVPLRVAIFQVPPAIAPLLQKAFLFVILTRNHFLTRMLRV